jgi:hypothetical protein
MVVFFIIFLDQNDTGLPWDEAGKQWHRGLHNNLSNRLVSFFINKHYIVLISEGYFIFYWGQLTPLALRQLRPTTRLSMGAVYSQRLPPAHGAHKLINYPVIRYLKKKILSGHSKHPSGLQNP